MNSITFFLFFIPILGLILLSINLIFAPHNAYQEKSSTFECGFHSFLGQNRTQFSISFFVFALLFLVFDLELVIALPGLISMSTIMEYGISIMIVFFTILTIGFAFELGKKALNIDSRQYSNTKQAAVYEKSLNIRVMSIFLTKMLRLISSIIYILMPWSFLSIIFHIIKTNRDGILLLSDGFYVEDIPVIGTIMPSLYISSLCFKLITIVVSFIIYNYSHCKLIFYFLLLAIKIHLYKNWLEYLKFISLLVTVMLLGIYYPYFSRISAFIILYSAYCYVFYLTYNSFISYYKYDIAWWLYLLISLIGVIIGLLTNTLDISFIDYSNPFFTDVLLVNSITPGPAEEFYVWFRFPPSRDWIGFLRDINKDSSGGGGNGGGPGGGPNYYHPLPGENEDQRKQRVNSWLRHRAELYKMNPVRPLQVDSAWETLRREQERSVFISRIHNQCSINEILIFMDIVPIRVQDYGTWEALGDDYSLRHFRPDLNKYLKDDRVNYHLESNSAFVGTTDTHPDRIFAYLYNPSTSLVISPTTLSHILLGMRDKSPPMG